MKDRIVLVLYFCAVLLITLVHDIVFLIAALALLTLLARRRFFKIAKKALIAIAIFNSVVTVSYCIVSIIKGNFSFYYIALINLRVFLMTSLTFLVVERINPFKALAFSSSLSYLLTLAYSQILTLRRLFGEFHLALKSRSLTPLSAKDLYRHGASTSAFFLHKSINDAVEITQAMKSRGFFND